MLSAVQGVGVMHPYLSKIGRSKGRDHSSSKISNSCHAMDVFREVAMES